MNLRLAVIIALVTGFVSISMEIVWFSIIGYLIKGHAGIFGLVLSLILFGIAYGARIGYRTLNKPNTDVLQSISKILLVAGVINLIGFPLIAWLMTVHVAFAALIVFNIVGISGMLGCVFPLLCHVAVSSNEQKVGKQTSMLYAANIIGSTSGPLVTGYFLIDYFPLKTLITGLCIILFVVAVILSYQSTDAKKRVSISAGVLLIVVSLLSFNSLYAHFMERIHYKTEYTEAKAFKHLIQNKSGTISVDQNDVFYGGGAFDGSINTDPNNASNGIQRAYMVAALHPSPDKVLMIGLSTGSWAKVLADYTKIKELTIVEINAGYIDLIKQYKEVADILKNTKVNIIVDDGRRWLKRNSDKKFDVIVMNTSYHWRENITNLLSADFLTLCKNSLLENGVMYWNTTYSPDVIYTAATVFNHVTRYQNFVAGSDKPFALTHDDKLNNFYHFIRENDTLFVKAENQNMLYQFVQAPLTDVHDSILQLNLWQITDNNMATEYKAGVWHKPNWLK